MTPTNIFEWFAEFGKLVKTLLNNIGCPLIDFVVLIGITTYSAFNSLKTSCNYYYYY